jgi:hypothetical protein
VYPSVQDTVAVLPTVVFAVSLRVKLPLVTAGKFPQSIKFVLEFRGTKIVIQLLKTIKNLRKCTNSFGHSLYNDNNAKFNF